MQKETLILASNNAGKLREMREILEPFGLEVRSQKEAGFTAEVAETGTTFQENAIIKAKAVQEALHCAVLAFIPIALPESRQPMKIAAISYWRSCRVFRMNSEPLGLSVRFVTLPQTANSIVLQAFARASLEQSRRAKMGSVMTRYLSLGTRQWQR